MLQATVLDTPVGSLSLIADGDTLVASGFTADAESLQRRLPPALRAQALDFVADLGVVSKAHAAYFEGDIEALDDVPVAPHGTGGQVRLWDALRAVPPGTTVSYSQLAARAGSPTAVRVAANACARNLIAPAIPCHRVVRSDGGLGGYYYGLDVKRWLLAHEAGRRSA